MRQSSTSAVSDGDHACTCMAAKLGRCLEALDSTRFTSPSRKQDLPCRPDAGPAMLLAVLEVR